MGIGHRIKEAREQLGLTQKELAAMIGVTAAAVTNYETGVSHPKEPILYKLLSCLKVDANYLFQDEMASANTIFTASFFEQTIIKKYRSLDSYGKDMVDTVLNKEHGRCQAQAELAEEIASYAPHKSLALYELPVSAGPGVLLQDEQFEFITIPPSGITDKADFALRVFGDSMEPKFHTGDIILVQASSAVDAGEIGVFVLNGSGYVKRCGGNGHLISLNPVYPDIIVEEGDSFKTLGRVLGKVK